VRCSGSRQNGTGSLRGACDDDAYVKRLALKAGQRYGAASNGSCLCNAPFQGDQREMGECPSGSEPSFDINRLGICQRCRAGRGKLWVARLPWGAWAPGQYAAGVHGVCSPCAAGRRQTGAGIAACDVSRGGSVPSSGQASGDICPAGTAAAGGDVKCETWPLGFVTAPGGSQCTACLGGHGALQQQRQLHPGRGRNNCCHRTYCMRCPPRVLCGTNRAGSVLGMRRRLGASRGQRQLHAVRSSFIRRSGGHAVQALW
jgi:hypothetical protein